jgi:hypothetical protein
LAALYCSVVSRLCSLQDKRADGQCRRNFSQCFPILQRLLFLLQCPAVVGQSAVRLLSLAVFFFLHDNDY